MKQLSIVIVLVIIAGSFAGQDLSYRQYSTKEGLPSAQVYHMFQDDLGYMWFATDRGIAKYDGTTIVQYDQRNGLPSSTVFKFYPQRNGDVWCSTFENKWFYFNPNQREFKPYKYNDTVVKYSIGGLNEDFVLEEDGTVHIGYQNLCGVLSMDSDGEVLNKPYILDNTIGAGVLLVAEEQGANQLEYFLGRDSTDKDVSGVLKNSRTKTCWFTPAKGHYSKTTLLNEHAIFSVETQLLIQGPDAQYKKITVDKSIIGMGTFGENEFWVGLRKGGIRVYNLKGDLIHHFLINESVTWAFHDQHKGLWISTLSNGVFYARDNRIRKHVLNSHVSYVNNGQGKQVLVGTYEGEIYECLAERSRFLADGGTGTPAMAVLNKTIGGYAIFSGGRLIFPEIEMDYPGWVGSISENERKPVLFGSLNKIYWWDNVRKELRTRALSERVRSIAWAQEGIWVGTLSGLFFCDTLDRSIERVSNAALQKRIEAIRSTGSASFFGTMGDGLVIKSRDTTFKISMKDGLSSNLVHELFVENDSIVWVGTNNGLNRVCIYTDHLQIDIYNEKDGLQDNYISDVHVKNDQVWIGTRSGLFLMQKPPVQVVSSAIDLRLRIESIYHDGRILQGKELSELSHDKNDLLVNYNTIFFGGNESVEYRYKLAGIDKTWTTSFSRTVSYKALAPDSYRLVIQARTKGAEWSQNEENLDFTISPPFYKTTWFILLVVFITVLIIYLFFKIRVLSYNRDIVRELMRVLLNRLTPKSKQFMVRVQGATVKVNSLDVGFVKSTGNYLEIHTTKNRLVTRMKIGDFENIPPDKLDYIRVNRSYIVRIDKITSKSPKSLRVLDQDIPIGRTYQKSISELLF